MTKLWPELGRVCKQNAAVILFGQGFFSAQLIMSNPENYRYTLIWDKVNRPTGFLDANRRPLRIHEDILVFYHAQPTYNPQMTYGEKCHRRGKPDNAVNGRNRCYGKFDDVPTLLTNEKFPTSILSFEKEHKNNGYHHPTMKPVALCEWLIKTYSNEGDIILDVTMGSGTTGVAAVNTNRSFIGMELTEEYFNIASERIRLAEIEMSQNLFKLM